MRRFRGRVALVTGGGSGIGAAAARRLAAEGAIVYAADLQPGADPPPAGSDIRPVRLDVTASADVDALVGRIADECGALHAVVNAAGVPDSPRRLRAESSNDLSEITDDDWQAVIDVNLTGTFYVVRATVPLLRRNGPAGGAIVTIASVGALANYPLAAAYPASKAGVLGLTRTVAALLGPDNIRVNAIAPGAIDTPMMPQDPDVRRAVVALGVLNRTASPDELAASIAFLASDEGAFYTGQTLSPNGGYVM
ncbi:MAG: SDR family NAD(P)-dependent oxidoreductase [Actinomycetaceae bacterium]